MSHDSGATGACARLHEQLWAVAYSRRWAQRRCLLPAESQTVGADCNGQRSSQLY